MFGPCWPLRWWHRRLRAADMGTIWPALVATMYGKYQPAIEAERQIQRAWTLFTEQRGQEHWRCPCADEHYLSRRTDNQ